MPTLTVRPQILETLGVSLTHVNELDRDAKQVLKAMLVSHGFNVSAVIHVARLLRDEGFVLTQ